MNISGRKWLPLDIIIVRKSSQFWPSYIYIYPRPSYSVTSCSYVKPKSVFFYLLSYRWLATMYLVAMRRQITIRSISFRCVFFFSLQRKISCVHKFYTSTLRCISMLWLNRYLYIELRQHNEDRSNHWQVFSMFLSVACTDVWIVFKKPKNYRSKKHDQM